MIDQAVRAGTLSDLQTDGRLLAKVGSVPVVVFWHEGEAYAIEDRCPHLGFPLHQGTVESGLVTCHWHHARFDLVSGCTLDLWADDARGFTAEVRDGDVFVEPRADDDPVGHLHARLRDGLEEGITLVVAKSVLGLLDAGVSPAEIVRTGVDFGTTYRGAGWGAGLTVLVAMANLFPHLDADDRPLALVHGLAFVSNDTANQTPRFPVGPLPTQAVPMTRLAAWYRRFIETRSSDSAERALETALSDRSRLDAVEATMFAAVSDHVFIDGGHSIDFTNKAFEALDLLGPDAAAQVLPTLVAQTTRAQRSEEFSEWRHPHDLVALAAETAERLERATPTPVLRIYLDRFLNVPAARPPRSTNGSIDALNRCFDTQGMVDEAADEAYGFLRAGGARAELIVALGRALLAEDAGFHWFQTVEAGVRQATAWPEGSEESALILVAVARFLAAHTPTRRELPTVARIAARLRRGEALYEDEAEADESS